jgi:hypothetical protein
MGNIVHGMRRSKEYKSWAKAKERTGNPNCQDYKDYGAVGVLMCEEFRLSFKAFIDYIGRMPSDGQKYTLGRIDNKKGYERGNIRWETSKQQARNKGLQSNNSSGVSGVTWDEKLYKGISYLYAKAQWNDLTGKLRNKSFSTRKYGLLPAFKLACEYREKMIQELNTNGAGYSDKHGK